MCSTTNTISNNPAVFAVVSLARLGSWGLDWKLGGNVLFSSPELQEIQNVVNNDDDIFYVFTVHLFNEPMKSEL